MNINITLGHISLVGVAAEGTSTIWTTARRWCGSQSPSTTYCSLIPRNVGAPPPTIPTMSGVR